MSDVLYKKDVWFQEELRISLVEQLNFTFSMRRNILQRTSVTVTAVALTIGYIESFLAPKEDLPLSFSDTLPTCGQTKKEFPISYAYIPSLF